MTTALGVGGGVALGGLGVALAGMGIAAAQGKCGGNIGGVISVGDCRGEYLINISNTVFKNTVDTFSASLEASSRNETIITNVQNVTINNIYPGCNVNVAQNIFLGQNVKSGISTQVKRDTVSKLITELKSNIESSLDSVTGVLSSGGVRDNLTTNVKQALTQIDTTDQTINTIINQANSLIASTSQNVTINYAKLDAEGLKDFYINPGSCNININQGVILSMTLDSLITSTIGAFNSNENLTRSLVEMAQTIKNESKGIDTITEQIAGVFKSMFATTGLIVIAAIIGFAVLAYFVLQNPEGVKALSGAVTDMKGGGSKPLQKLKIYKKNK